MEVMWHVVTLMPSKSQEADEQQIHIKRQVGNDHVHIVWSEYGRDYRPSTISSQFNDAHIVVYPMRSPAPAGSSSSGGSGGSQLELGLGLGALPSSLDTCLFRVSIFRKASVPAFGPLQDNMVVRGASLAKLVRLTALNANRAIRYATAGYGRPYPTRQKYINEILAKHTATTAATPTAAAASATTTTTAAQPSGSATTTTAAAAISAPTAVAPVAVSQPASIAALSSILMPLLVQGAQ